VHYLIISDVHANLTALEAVLADAPEFDEIWCLGDLVGYGPNPNECIERIQDFSHVSMAGNHDWAALGKLDLSSFNTDARDASIWTQAELSPAAREYLNELPIQIEKDGFNMAHASPREPIWEYILDANQAYANRPDPYDHQPRQCGPTPRWGPARQLRDARSGCNDLGVPPRRLSGRDHPGADARSGPAAPPRRAARDGALAQVGR